MRILRRILIGGLLAGLVLAAGGRLYATGDEVAAAPELALAPLPEHTAASRTITTLFETTHYRRVRVDDDISNTIFSRYIENLDPNRIYFLRDDVESLGERFRFVLDDKLKSGNVWPAYEIFTRYRQRVDERITTALSSLESKPSFDTDETFEFDREDADWFVTRKQQDEYWRKRVKNDALSLLLAEREWDDIVDVLSKRYDQVRRRVNQVNSADVFETFMNAYAGALDPHTSYFSPRNSEEYRIQMSLSYDGIGASLRVEDEYVMVLDIIPGGPAAITEKLKPQDRITGVGQGNDGAVVDVIGWRLDDVVQLIRGERGTTVRLQILEAGKPPGSEEKLIALERNKIKLEEQAAKSEVLEIQRDGASYRVGVIDVPSFYQDFDARQAGDKDFKSTTADVRRLVKEMKADGIDALVIDLRNNGGGHLSEARDLTGLFIELGPVVQLRSSTGRIEIIKDRDPGVVYTGPMAVLVNRFSASASEIFAGAMQDYERAVVVGQQTFGKGTVQHLYDLDQYANRHRRIFAGQSGGFGQLTITTGKYYRVTGESTQHKGVIPDIELPFAIDPSEVGENTRESALDWDQIGATKFETGRALDAVVDELEASHRSRATESADFAYLTASIDDARKLRARTTVSLNLETRREDRENVRIRRFDRENERRKRLGIEPLADIEALDESEPPDVVLDEAAQIVLDLAKHGRPMTAKRGEE